MHVLFHTKLIFELHLSASKLSGVELFYQCKWLREGFKKKKKVWNFPYFSGVGGFEKVIFHKK